MNLGAQQPEASGDQTLGAAPEIPNGSSAPLLPPWRRLLGHFAGFGASHLAVQTTSLLAGLLFVNWMSREQFALYTLGSSLVAFMVFLSDLGVTGSMVYFAHRAAREGSSFDRFVAAVFGLRRGALTLVALAIVVAFPVVARVKGFGGAGAWLATLAIVVIVAAQVESALQLQLLRLRGHMATSYRAEVVGSGVRLLLAVALVALAMLEAWIALASVAIATSATALLARLAQAPLAVGGAPLREERRAVLRYLLPTLPGAVYFSLRGQLTVWLAASFGGTLQLAEVGALGRLGLLFGFFASFGSVVVLPRLAHLRDEHLWRRRALLFGAGLAAVGGGLLAVAAIAPQPFLFLLGPNYRGLEHELLLVVASAAIGLLDGYLVSLNMSRAWTRWNGVAVAALAICQALLVLICPLGTTAGILWFNLLSGLAALTGQAVITTIGFRRPKAVAWA